MSRSSLLLTRGGCRLAGLLVFFLCATTSGFSQDPPEEEPYLPGLVASFRDGKGNTAVRLDHRLAFHWGKAAPDPRLTRGEFQAVWQGHLFVRDRGDYRFSLFGSGVVSLEVAGRKVVDRQTLHDGWHQSPPVALAAGFLPLTISFRKTNEEAHLMVLWSGPDFAREPIPPRFLFHPRERVVERDFERGKVLARALRCGRCHGEVDPSPPGPALDRLSGNLSRGWLVRWLAEGMHDKDSKPQSPRRMPEFGLSGRQAEAIADWLLAKGPGRKEPARKEKKPGRSRPRPSAKLGEKLFLTTGCLACHRWREVGSSGWFGGGDLTHIADKRPAHFFSTWLADPARLNRDHRMPVFSLSADERTSLALFLAEQGTKSAKPDFRGKGPADRVAEGGKLVERFRCATCHRLPGEGKEKPGRPTAPRLGKGSAWDRACSGAADPGKQRPGYRLNERDARALRSYYTRLVHPEGGSAPPDRALLMVEHNCLSCHAREGTREAFPLLPSPLTDTLTAVGERYPDLAPLVPALTPPALDSVGDKLTDRALADAILRRGDPHRPYLQVRMPRFPLREDELKGLVQYLVRADRIPEEDGPTPPEDPARKDLLALAGGRLVSSDGFGCTSCHRVGTTPPPQAPLNARGPNLTGLAARVRRPWFDRFVHDPARIVPRMEMPSVQTPVSGVLDEKLDDQLAAVWHVLNLPGFEPPLPNPVRILRHRGQSSTDAPLVVTDVLRQGGKTWIKPFLVGLTNRHNVLLDLETAGLALWTVGDTARQRTKGKTWSWELAGTPLLDPELSGPDLSLTAAGRVFTPRKQGQFLTEADFWESDGPALVLKYHLRLTAPGTDAVTLQVQRRLSPLPAKKEGDASGFRQELTVGSLPPGARVRLKVLSPAPARKARRSADGRTLQLGDRFSSRIVLREPARARFSEDRTEVVLVPDDKGTVRVVLHYESEVPIDRFPEPAATPALRKGGPVQVAPGLAGERLALPATIMPTGLTWRPDGRLVFCSLKGQVFEVPQTEDRLRLLVDGLPAPYGVHAGPGYVDVSAKYAVLRLSDRGGKGQKVETVASGWGYTTDYHDWAVGLPRNRRGEYFLGIPCQQDKRSREAARFHGSVLKLVPRRPTAEDPRRFSLKPLSTGHRFPMGLALDRNGELFVTDNQGNYNPFNELNHVRPGVHFGFINALDRGKPAPPLTPPAIDIPHPWTRSVNGICFLDTPSKLRERRGGSVFGALEGHLIGCEYDTRRLIRMTLQRVGDTFQGAAYPLSIPPRDPAQGFMGPVVCAVSPRGALYVGSIRDSGWGGGNNLGEVVRVRVRPEELPCGIAEVRATADGFTLDFFRPVDRERAGRGESYLIQSYRRQSTPAYGGKDQDRRTEKLAGITVGKDGRRVTLRLGKLRAGFVYEFRLQNLAPGEGTFHPAEAHYTLRAVPR
jgi:mono/diheme cytochrome c family protein